MPRQRHVDPLALAAALTLTVIGAYVAQGFSPAQSDAATNQASVLHAILTAEDARAILPADLQTIVRAAGNPSPEVQRVAIRALGRLERDAVLGSILPALGAAAAAVRIEAANALAQAVVHAGADPERQVPRVADALSGALAREEDPGVRGALLQSLGRLPFQTPADRAQAETRLAAALEGPRAPGELLGALTGLESLYRTANRAMTPAASVMTQLDRVFLARGAALQVGVRALSAAIAASHANGEVIASASQPQSSDDQIRRLAILAAMAPTAPVDRRAILTAGLRDPSPMVRFEALRAYGRQFQSTDCGPVREAVSDAAASVALLALDLLGEPCPAAPPATDLLMAAASGDDWRRAAHAFVSLARRVPDQARRLLPRMLTHPVWQARMYAARGAAALGDGDALVAFTSDPNDNVRESAIGGLAQVRGHAADDAYIAALGRPDYQLVRTAARALQGTDKKKAASEALLAAFTRITAQGRDTARDPRLAILQRLRETGTEAQIATLEPCLTDFDPRIAAECGRMLLESQPRPRAFTAAAPVQPPAPTADEIERLKGARVRITMAGGRTFEMTLMTDDAPLSVARFARLARAGYYNGLTFHRVVPNFVIQGGSPGANEYVGDGPFMRDEVGLRSHVRGTVGISTRGRDTGDAQIFINLVDNTRLDHVYTVFAEVVRGLDVVDSVLEGDVMEKVEIVK